MKRINVIGTTGTGKSTFATALAKELDYPCIHMDQLFWKAGWQESGEEEFRDKISLALCGETWVLDGNYSRTEQFKWQRADTVIWLDYSFLRTFWQLLFRTIRRSVTREELWPNTGNRESLGKAFFSRDSILLWFFRTYTGNKKNYALISNSPQWSHINFIHLTSPSAADEFIHLHTRSQE